MIIDPQTTDARNIYKLMIGAIVPRPIAFVSTIGLDGVYNLAPFSFFTGVSGNPPAICFCPMVKIGPDPRKDTLRNIEAIPEFVVNVVSEEFAEKMNVCSGEYPPDMDEFAISGLTPIPSDLVKAPRVKESHVNMECKLIEIVRVSAKPLGGSIVVVEVLRFHVEDGYVDDFRIDLDRLRAIGRMSGNSYARTRERFDMVRPKV